VRFTQMSEGIRHPPCYHGKPHADRGGHQAALRCADDRMARTPERSGPGECARCARFSESSQPRCPGQASGLRDDGSTAVSDRALARSQLLFKRQAHVLDLCP
jgi:hypothetical protein